MDSSDVAEFAKIPRSYTDWSRLVGIFRKFRYA